MPVHALKDLGIRVMRNVPEISKGSTHGNQLLGITGLPCSGAGGLKFEVKISTDPHVHGEVNAHEESGVLILNTWNWKHEMLYKGKQDIRNRILESKGIENKPSSFFFPSICVQSYPLFSQRTWWK